MCAFVNISCLGELYFGGDKTTEGEKHGESVNLCGCGVGGCTNTCSCIQGFWWPQIKHKNEI